MSENLKSYWKQHRTIARFAAFGFMIVFPFIWGYCILRQFKNGKDAVFDELKDGPGVFACAFLVCFRP